MIDDQQLLLKIITKYSTIKVKTYIISGTQMGDQGMQLHMLSWRCGCRLVCGCFVRLFYQLGELYYIINNIIIVYKRKYNITINIISNMRLNCRTTITSMSLQCVLIIGTFSIKPVTYLVIIIHITYCRNRYWYVIGQHVILVNTHNILQKSLLNFLFISIILNNPYRLIRPNYMVPLMSY